MENPIHEPLVERNVIMVNNREQNATQKGTGGQETEEQHNILE